MDFLFVNVIEGRELAGVDENRGPGTITRALADMFPESGIVLTAGSRGAWYARGGTTEHTDAVDTSVIDTTGAGDTFTGFFLAAMMKHGLTARESLVKASGAAAATISRKGTIDAMPSEADIF